MANGVNGSSDLNGRPAPTEHNGAAGLEVPGATLTPTNAEDSRILAAMDKLRELGIDRKYELPQIIVCGAQSAGKSSVLESLVQVPFPRGGGTCTRYVTKVTMLPAKTPSVEVRIKPGNDRDPSDDKALRAFHRQDKSANSAASLARFMEEAHRLILPGTAGDPMISNDIMLITVYRPGTRPLQVLDLPGLTQYDQPTYIELIRSIVNRYMAKKRSIILAVLQANLDIQVQEVLQLCDTHDRDGERTICVITRPDMADNTQKADLVEIIQGRNEKFKSPRRWHLLRNRTSEERNTAQEVRDHEEKILLDSHPWNRLDEGSRGIGELRERLRELLFGVAKKALPELCGALRDELGRLDEKFNALGGRDAESGKEHLEKAMHQSLQRLRDASSDHARGIYEHDVDDSEVTGSMYLRSRVEDKSDIFHDKLFAIGHAWKTLIRLEPPDPNSDLGSIHREGDLRQAVSKIEVHGSRQEEIDKVVNIIKKLRTQNLPTFHDPRLIGRLFRLMSSGWNAIASDHIEQIHQCCKRYFREVTPVAFRRESRPNSVGFSNFGVVARRFVNGHLLDSLEKCRDEALKELQRLEEDRKAAPLNSDKRFLEDWRSHRQEREFTRAMKAHHKMASSANDPTAPAPDLDKTTYAKYAELHSQDDWTKATADEYLDAMWSHYRVCLPMPSPSRHVADQPSLSQIERDIYIMNVLRQVSFTRLIGIIALVQEEPLIHMIVDRGKAFLAPRQGNRAPKSRVGGNREPCTGGRSQGSSEEGVGVGDRCFEGVSASVGGDSIMSLGCLSVTSYL